jgi:hypothetical protein
VAQWEAENLALLEKRKIAGSKNTKTKWTKGISGNPAGNNWWNEEIHQMTQTNLSDPEHTKMAQTTQTNLSQTHPDQNVHNHPDQFVAQTLPYDPRSADPSDDPSTVSTAVSQNRVSELVSEDSFASLTHSAADGSKNTFEQEKQQAKEEAFAEAMLEDKSPLVKQRKHDQDSRIWIEAGEFFNSIWPNKLVRDEDVELLLDLAEEVGHGNLVHGGEIIKQTWEWNQIHKQGKYKLFSLAELAKALRSTNDRNLVAQMQAHRGCKLCEGFEQDTDNTKSKVLDTPPASAAPPGDDDALDPDLCKQCQNHPRQSAQGYCEFCFRNHQGGNGRAATEDYLLPDLPKAVICPHGYLPAADCQQCSHPPNATCRWKECGKRFHGESWKQQFCCPECGDKYEARQAELKAKYAKPEPKHRLAAFLEGQY